MSVMAAISHRLPRGRGAGAPILVAAVAVAFILVTPALAQGYHHPFAIGANEGGVGRVSGIGAWLIAKESYFYLLLSGAIRAAKHNGSAEWGLIGLSFAYGVFHAAGPGHGKAVITSYMISNERALRRGLVIAALAALFQGLVAIALVGVAAIIFRATAPRMTEAAHAIEIAGYVGIVALGVALVYRKGAALVAALRIVPPESALALPGLAWNMPQSSSRGFFADDCSLDHVHGPTCGHVHAPDPRTLGEGFSWKAALLTIVTAGARPCSGAILVLVFALAQGIFLAGVGATLAMSVGTALTTGALATFAVFAKTVAVRVSGAGSPRSLIIGRLIETAAAVGVLVVGIALLIAALAGAVTTT